MTYYYDTTTAAAAAAAAATTTTTTTTTTTKTTPTSTSTGYRGRRHWTTENIHTQTNLHGKGNILTELKVPVTKNNRNPSFPIS